MRQFAGIPAIAVDPGKVPGAKLLIERKNRRRNHDLTPWRHRRADRSEPTSKRAVTAASTIGPTYHIQSARGPGRADSRTSPTTWRVTTAGTPQTHQSTVARRAGSGLGDHSWRMRLRSSHERAYEARIRILPDPPRPAGRRESSTWISMFPRLGSSRLPKTSRFEAAVPVPMSTRPERVPSR